jgi:hypothetical protein
VSLPAAGLSKRFIIYSIPTMTSARLRLGIKQLSCFAVILLTLWLSGFGCAFCCSTGLGNHCCTSQQNICGAETQADCCKPEKMQSASTNEPVFSSLPDVGCPLLPNQTPGEFRQSNLTNLGVAIASVTPFILQPKAIKYAPVSTHSMLPANRGSTYLRCGVFLI